MNLNLKKPWLAGAVGGASVATAIELPAHAGGQLNFDLMAQPTLAFIAASAVIGALAVIALTKVLKRR